MTWRLAALVAILFATGCSADAAASGECQALERELVTARQQLAEVTEERDGLVAELEAAGSDGAADGMLSAEVSAVLDGYTAALFQGDGEAMLDHVTDDFTFLSYGTDVQDRDFRADYVTRNYAGFVVDRIGEPMILGGDDRLILAVPERATTPEIAEGFSTMRLVRVDGEWLIDVHRFTGE